MRILQVGGSWASWSRSHNFRNQTAASTPLACRRSGFGPLRKSADPTGGYLASDGPSLRPGSAPGQAGSMDSRSHWAWRGSTRTEVPTRLQIWTLQRDGHENLLGTLGTSCGEQGCIPPSVLPHVLIRDDSFPKLQHTDTEPQILLGAPACHICQA